MAWLKLPLTLSNRVGFLTSRLKAFTLCNLECNGNETGETILYFVLHSVISAPDSPALHHLFYR